jgi:hypothetical protein
VFLRADRGAKLFQVAAKIPRFAAGEVIDHVGEAVGDGVEPVPEGSRVASFEPASTGEPVAGPGLNRPRSADTCGPLRSCCDSGSSSSCGAPMTPVPLPPLRSWAAQQLEGKDLWPRRSPPRGNGSGR